MLARMKITNLEFKEVWSFSSVVAVHMPCPTSGITGNLDEEKIASQRKPSDVWNKSSRAWCDVTNRIKQRPSPEYLSCLPGALLPRKSTTRELAKRCDERWEELADFSVTFLSKKREINYLAGWFCTAFNACCSVLFLSKAREVHGS